MGQCTTLKYNTTKTVTDTMITGIVDEMALIHLDTIAIEKLTTTLKEILMLGGLMVKPHLRGQEWMEHYIFVFIRIFFLLLMRPGAVAE